MYATPADVDYFSGINGTHTNHGGNIGNRSGIAGNFNTGARLPAFNAAFLQTPPLHPTVDPYALDMVALRYAQHHQTFRGIQHKQFVQQQHHQQYSALHNINGGQNQEHPIIESAFVAGKCDNRSYSSYDPASSRPAPFMARLPTIPASSLMHSSSQAPAVGQHQVGATPNVHSSVGIHPHQSQKSHAAVVWDSQPPYRNVVISRSNGDWKSEMRNGMAPPGLNGKILDGIDQRIPISLSVHAKVPPASMRTADEKEAAAILAGFASPSIPLRHPKSEGVPACDNRQAVLQRQQQQNVKSSPILQGATAAATAENIVRFAELQKQHRQYSPVVQNGIPTHHPGGNIRQVPDGIRPTMPTVLQQQFHHVEAKLLGQPAVASQRPMRADEFLLKQLSERATLEKGMANNGALFHPEQHQSLLRQISGVQQRFPVPTDSQPSNLHAAQVSNHQQQQQACVQGGGRAAASTSSALNEFLVTEFIRQLEPAANGGAQDAWRQQDHGPYAGTIPDQRQTADIRQSGMLFSPTILQRNGQPTLTESRPHLPPSAPIHAQKPQPDIRLVNRQHVTVGQQPAVIPQDRHGFIQHTVQMEQNKSSQGMESLLIERAPSSQPYVNGASAVGIQNDQELKPKSHPVQMVNGQHHSDRSTPGGLQSQTPNFGNKSEQTISNGHVAGKVADPRLSVVQNGRVNKKPAAMALLKKKIAKALVKPVKSMVKSAKNSAGGKLPIGELQLPSVSETNPLSVSTIGLLSRLAKNSARASRAAKKQHRRKDAKSSYYERLPTMFGPVAASLSLSNGATTNLSNLSGDITASNASASSSIESQARQNGVVTNGKKHVYAKITLKQELATFVSDRIMLPDGTLESEASLKDRLENNVTQPVHKCSCLPQVDEDVEGPYYTHLAAAASVKMMRSLLEERYGEKGEAIRIEKVRFTNKEGKTPDGCPIAKWVIRRSSFREKILCVVRQRPHHFCSTAVIAICIVIWEGVEERQADDLYSYLVGVLPKYGVTTNRRCETNEKRLCACQGINQSIGGASFSFGCSWSMYSNTCKFCKSRGDARKFKLQLEANTELESVLEEKCHNLADAVAPVFKRMAPACYRNQTYYSERAQSCRLGYVPRGPFSGITACVDFCAHAHKDIHNMNNGCTVVVTLTKHRGLQKPDDEQLHVLPLCVLDSTDEFGSQETQWQKTQTGSLEILGAYPMNLRLRRNPLPCCKERTKQLNKRPGRPMKAKQPRLETRTPEIPQAIQGVSSWPSFSSINDIDHQAAGKGTLTTPPVNGNGEQKQRLPSMDTFSQFYSARMQAEQKMNMFQYSNGPFYSNGTTAMSTSFSQPAKDLAGFAQGFRTPPMVSRDADEGDCGQDESIYVTYTENREAFADSRVGGVAIALSHGSVLLEVAKRELHATTALKTPDRRDPKRISLVFYQHKHLHYSNHGAEELEKKTAAKNGLKAQDPSETVLSSDDEFGDTGDGSKIRVGEQWPDLPPLKMDGEWRAVGASDLCMSLTRDKMVTASSSKTSECLLTQKYIGQIATVRVTEGKVSK